MNRKVGRCAIHFSADSSKAELYFARSILQVSSVSTEQSRIGSADSWSTTFKHGEIRFESVEDGAVDMTLF